MGRLKSASIQSELREPCWTLIFSKGMSEIRGCFQPTLSFLHLSSLGKVLSAGVCIFTVDKLSQAAVNYPRLPFGHLGYVIAEH